MSDQGLSDDDDDDDVEMDSGDENMDIGMILIQCNGRKS